MDASQLEQIRARHISTLGLSTRMVGILFEIAHAPIHPNKPDEMRWEEFYETDVYKAYDARSEEFAQKDKKTLRANLTIGEVMQGIERLPLRTYNDDYKLRRFRYFFQKLRVIGVTEADWVYITAKPTAIAWETLKRAAEQGKECLLDQPIWMFGSCANSPLVLDDLNYHLHRHPDDKSPLLIRDVLRIGYGDGISSRVEKAVLNLRKKMRDLGLGYDDGPFLQFGSRRARVERIMKILGRSRRSAEQFLADMEKVRGKFHFID